MPIGSGNYKNIMITSSNEKIEQYTKQGSWGDRKLHDLLYANAKNKKDFIALVDPLNKVELMGHEPLRLTFNELTNKIDSLTCVLIKMGIKKDDIMLVQMPNIVELVYLYMAASRIGAIISPVAMQYKQHELTEIANVLKPKVIITVSKFKLEDFITHIDATLQRIDYAKPRVLVWGEHDKYTNLYDEMVAPIDANLLEQYSNENPISANDIITICWTSGTEGLPKGIPRSHNHWLVTGLATFHGSEIKQGEALLNPFPFINMASIGGLFLSWLYNGGKLVLHHPLDFPLFLRQIVEEEIEYTLVPPALLNNILKNEQLQALCDFSKIRAIGSGSAPLDEWMVQGYKEKYNIEIINHFGSNEGMSLLCGPSHANTSEKRARLFPRASNLLESRIIDLETGAIVDTPDHEGELQIKGGGVFDGYFGAEDKNKECFTEDGFFKTGDLFVIEGTDTNFYRFVGRNKDIIIRGGMNIAPAELDSLLCSHPDIVEAAVASYPCDIMGEKIAAFVVNKEGSEITLNELTDYLRSCEIANYKLPEKLITTHQLPRNALGKVVRFELANELKS
jgi:acyl-coenzyme A synthetase/AMP-(fatty) acid ligase